MAVELFEKFDAPATVEDVMREVSRLKSVVTDAVEDGVKSAVKTINKGRSAAEDAMNAAEDYYDDAKRMVKRNPVEAVGICFAAGVVTGCLVTWLGSRRRW